MLGFRGLTASLLLDITYLTSVHEDGVSKLSARRHEKKHRSAAASTEPPGSEGKAEGEGLEQKESAAATSDLRVSHSLDEVKAHAATRSESEICSVASGGGSEGVFTSAPAESSRRKGHEHGCRGHEPPTAAGPSEVHAVQLSYLYLGATKALSTLLSCSKYAELLLIPKVPQLSRSPSWTGPQWTWDQTWRRDLTRCCLRRCRLVLASCRYANEPVSLSEGAPRSSSQWTQR